MIDVIDKCHCFLTVYYCQLHAEQNLNIMAMAKLNNYLKYMSCQQILRQILYDYA